MNNQFNNQFNNQLNNQFNNSFNNMPGVQAPGFNANQNSFGMTQMMTVLAPSDTALLGIKDDLMQNASALDEFIANHIIVDNAGNNVFYTDHDTALFQSSQSYATLNPSLSLTAKVSPDLTGIRNVVTLQAQNNAALRTRVVSGNSRVSNGVVHVVDRALTTAQAADITTLLERYSAQSMPNQPAFNQFVDALRSTGIFNDLKQPAKKYTLFIPTNEALSRYQDILNSNDANKKKNLLYRHICMDQNLQANYLQSGQSMTSQDLMCRNLLGQDLTLTMDQNGLVSKWSNDAQSKILNDFSGMYSSAYVLQDTLLNNNLPNYGLNNLNAGATLKANCVLLALLCCAFVLSKL
jgi:uncharacterized surface protein with fasciclin (FAS1) repeats